MRRRGSGARTPSRFPGGLPSAEGARGRGSTRAEAAEGFAASLEALAAAPGAVALGGLGGAG